MKLLTKEIIAKLPALYSQENNPDPDVVLKFFNPCGAATWYITEGEPGVYENEKGEPVTDWKFFGLCDLFGDGGELGYVMLSDLESVRLPLGLKIERDMYFTPKPLSKVRK